MIDYSPVLSITAVILAAFGVVITVLMCRIADALEKISGQVQVPKVEEKKP